jgi:hypothetical protein
LGQDGAGGVVHRGQQVHGAPLAVCSWWAAGAAQRLAVDADRLPPSLGVAIMAVAVAQPGADHRGHGLGVKPTKRTADGRLGWDGPVVGGVAAGTQRGPDRLGSVGGPFGDRGHRLRAGQHRGCRQGEDGDQRMAASGAGPWVGDGGQVGEQVRGFGGSERAGLAQRGQPRRDRG